jgi:8-oxo-dGTP diphosphatase
LHQPLWASVHNLEEIRLAENLGVDALVLSPVLATRSHPEAIPLGWTGFAALVAQTHLPVFALGGMRPEHAETVREYGGCGVAGVSGFGA